MKVVAVTNQKGGVGKTTTALSLAAELALAGQRVLGIDLDPQGNLGMGVGIDDGEGLSAYEVLTQRAPLEQAARPVRVRGLSRLRIVPAGPRLARAEGELLGQIGFDELLKRALARCGGVDVAVIDCPPSLGALTVNAVGAADLVIAPVQCEFFSARGAMKLLEIVELVRERRNPDLAFRVVPTLFDQRNNICRAVLSELRREFGAEVSETTIGVDTRVRESQARCVPIGVYAPRSRAAVAYRALAGEVLALCTQEVTRAQAA